MLYVVDRYVLCIYLLAPTSWYVGVEKMVARADARAKLTRVELFPPRFSTGYGTNSYVVLMLAEKPRKEKACPCPPPVLSSVFFTWMVIFMVWYCRYQYSSV